MVDQSTSERPPLIISEPTANGVQAGDKVTLTVAAQGVGLLTYQWSRDGVDIDGATSASHEFVARNADQGAKFKVAVSSQLGKTESTTVTLQVTEPAAPDASMNVERATLREDVVFADEMLQPSGTANTFVSRLPNWSVGQLFVVGQRPFKVTGTSAIIGQQNFAVRAEPVSYRDVFSDFKFNASMHALAYDSSGKAVSAAAVTRPGRSQKLDATRKSPQALVNGLGCILPKGKTRKATEASGTSEFGYDWEIDCSFDKLLGAADEGSGWRVKGKFSQTAKLDVIVDQAKQTDYQEQSTTHSGSMTLLVAGVLPEAQVATLKKLCKNFKSVGTDYNFCSVSTRSGSTSFEIARSILPVVEFKPVVLGVVVPMYVSVGLVLKVSFSATGEATLTYSTTKFVRSGHIRGVKVYDDPPAANDTLAFRPSLKDKVSLNAFVGGYFAFGLGEPDLISAADLRLDLGMFARGTFEPVPFCLSVEKGARLNSNLSIGRSPYWTGWKIVDVSSDFGVDKSLSPAACKPAQGSVFLTYLIEGRQKYNYDPDLSSATNDVYNAAHALIERIDPDVSKPITISLAGSSAPDGRLLEFDFAVLENSNNLSVNLRERGTVETGISKYLEVDPGSTDYGDVIKLRVAAYVPGDRAATEVERRIEIRIEDKLAANPYYFKRIDTDGAETYQIRMDYRGDTTSAIRGGPSQV